MIGAGHASGRLIASSRATIPSMALAGQSGGGLDLRLNQRVALRLFRIDRVPATFNNGGNNRQNNFRLGAGVAFRL
jgi:hypothetical protein